MRRRGRGPAVGAAAAGPSSRALRSAGDLEVLTDEDMVRGWRADPVDGVRAVAQLQHTVDGPARVVGNRNGLGLVRRRSGDDRSGPGTPVLRNLTSWRGSARLTDWRGLGRLRRRGRVGGA